MKYLHFHMGIQVAAPNKIALWLRALAMEVEDRNGDGFTRMALVMQQEEKPVETLVRAMQHV